MDKRIGNVLLICLFSCIAHGADQSIKLYLQDMNQNPIRQVETSVPFLLQVVAENIDGAEYPDTISGFEHFKVTKYGASQSTTIINGKKTERKIFNYVLQGDTSGSYQLGPVSMQDHGRAISSDILHFRVGDQTIAYNLKKQSYFLQVDIENKDIFVGQGVRLKIRFYYNQDFDQLKIVEPQFDGFYSDKKFIGPVEGQENTRGQDYRYKEWTVTLYPEEVGTKMIPAIQAIYTLPSHFQQGLGGLFDMFSLHADKSVYSAARSIYVKALPKTDQYQQVTAIGNFIKANLNLKKDTADIGEGIVATIEIIGSGNMEMMKAPKLQLPDGIRYYESNSTVDGSSKTFEYILQADRNGSFVIPSQTFVYFDPIHELYKTLKTEEQSLSIIGDVIIKQQGDMDDSKVDVSKEHIQEKSCNKYAFKDGQIDFVQEVGCFEQDGETTLGSFLSWLVVLLGLLVIVSSFYWVYLYVVGVPLLETYWLSYILFRIEAYHAYQKQDIRTLYELLETVSEKYNLELHGAKIPELFKKMGYDDQKIRAWNIFLEEMMRVLFSGEHFSVQSKQEVLKQSIMWLKELLACGRFLGSTYHQIMSKD